MTPTPEHEALLLALKAPIGVEGKDMDAAEILAVASQLVGQLIAIQDQGRFTTERVMGLVMGNIRIGNQTAIDQMFVTEGSA